MTTIKVTEQRSLQHYDHGENKGGSSRRPKIETRPDSATLQPQAKSLTLSLKEFFIDSSDLKVVFKEVYEVRAKWRRIGVELNLIPDTLDEIEQRSQDPADRMEMVLIEWLNKGTATWRELVDALFSVPVGETELSRQLERKYCMKGLVPPFSKNEVKNWRLNPDIRKIDARFRELLISTRDSQIYTKSEAERRERQREYVKHQLNRAIRIIERKFRDLLICTRDSLKARNVPLMALVNYLVAFYGNLPSVIEKERSLYLDDKKSELKSAKSIDEIFSTVVSFWSFLDFELLEGVINDKDLGADSDRQNLSEYVKSLNDFLDSWVVEPHKIPCYGSEPIGSQVKLHFKINTDSLSRYREVKAAIARILGVKLYELKLHLIDEGCTELVFLQLGPSIGTSSLSDEQSKELFAIVPSVLKATSKSDFEKETVLFERDQYVPTSGEAQHGWRRETELSPSEFEGIPLKMPDETSSEAEPSVSESFARPQGRRESESPQRTRWHHRLSSLNPSKSTQEVSRVATQTIEKSDESPQRARWYHRFFCSICRRSIQETSSMAAQSIERPSHDQRIPWYHRLFSRTRRRPTQEVSAVEEL